MTSIALPEIPPVLTQGLAPVAARLGAAPEDFVVDELPAYPLSGSGEHLFVRVRKRQLTTPDVLRVLARVAEVPERDIGCAGMKDKHAVTTQWFSFPARARPPETWSLPEGIQVVEATRHNNKLRTGQLGGNRFQLTLTGAQDEDLGRARVIGARLLEHGLVNYFGPQRFGREGRNLEHALEWLRQGANERGKQARFHRKLYPSVIQAEVFNRFTTLRSALGLERLIAGDVVRLAHSRAVFVVEDVEREQPRLLSRDIRLTGPIFGPKARAATGEALRLEQRAVDSLGVSGRDVTVLAGLADGTRRDLLVWPEGLELRAEPGGRLVVDFALPAGSYATQLLRELTHAQVTGDTRGEA